MNPNLTANLRAERELRASIAHQNQSPFTPADEQYLAEVLTECRLKLETALKTAQGYSRLPDLAAGIGDALTGCQEALTVLNDPQTYLE
jgi:hypothetical protein